MTLAATLGEIVGPGHLAVGEAAAALAFSPWTQLGAPAAVVRPATTAQVSAVLRAAAAAGAAVVPWGGRTGLVDGARADGAIALDLTRMAAVEEIDTEAATMTVQAGCVLATACDAAEAADLFLPLDLGARGSATIGGMIATNAGGNRVLRYGMIRDMVLGLEAVLADGTVVSGLNRLIKNNAGYDLKPLFIGTEGTLGVVTRAVLRLRPRPLSQNTAFLAIDGFEALPRLLRRLEGQLSGTLSAFEVMWPEFYQLVTSPPALGRAVVPPGHDYYVLVEALGGDPQFDDERFEQALGAALEGGLIADAVIARSQAERDRMWALRDDVMQTARHGLPMAFDVSLPIRAMPTYVDQVRRDLAALPVPARAVVFGHLGDGNLHLIVPAPEPQAGEAIAAVVYGALAGLDGSISAEHGIGLLKRSHLDRSRSPEEIALMRRLKAAMDPQGVLNPGKVLPLSGTGG